MAPLTQTQTVTPQVEGLVEKKTRRARTESGSPSAASLKAGPNTVIHPSAIIGDGVVIGRSCRIMAKVVIDDGARIGDEVTLYPGVFIGHQSEVGDQAVLKAGVTVRERCRVGKRCVLESGVVIGSDGFGFASSSQSGHMKIPQVGIVEIGDDVTIGSNTTVDRATLGRTVIGSGSRIGNLVQIAHNVRLGVNCAVGSQTGISGSTQVGDNVRIGSQVGIVGHVRIGHGAEVRDGSGVSKSVAEGAVISGVPAFEADSEEALRVLKAQLPDLFTRVKAMEKAVGGEETAD